MKNALTKHERLPRLEEHTRGTQVDLSDEQIRLLERFSPGFRERHIEVHATGELVAVDTSLIGTLKGVGKVDLQTVLDCFSRSAWARLYTSKLPITAVYVLNTDVLPFFDQHQAKIRTILSDNGREFCDRPDPHPYELFLQREEIEHRTTKVRRPQSNGFIERFHRTLLDEQLQPAGRTTGYETIEQMQAALELYPASYSTARPHRGRGMNARTPEEVCRSGLPKPFTPPERRKPKPLDSFPGGGDCQVNTMTVHSTNKFSVRITAILTEFSVVRLLHSTILKQLKQQGDAANHSTRTSSQALPDGLCDHCF